MAVWRKWMEDAGEVCDSYTELQCFRSPGLRHMADLRDLVTLMEASRLRSLTLRGTLEPEIARELFDYLGNNTELRTLDLRQGRCENELIGKFLALNKGVRSLFLFKMYDTNNLAAISTGIKLNTSIRVLDVGFLGDVDYSGISALTDALATNRSVRNLTLKYWDILRHDNVDHSAISMMAKVLAVNNILMSVKVCAGRISGAAAEELGRALKGNTGLKSLHIISERPIDEAKGALLELVTTNRGLRSIRIHDRVSVNSLVPDYDDMLENPILEEIDLEYQYSDVVPAEICAHLRANRARRLRRTFRGLSKTLAAFFWTRKITYLPGGRAFEDSKASFEAAAAEQR